MRTYQRIPIQLRGSQEITIGKYYLVLERRGKEPSQYWLERTVPRSNVTKLPTPHGFLGSSDDPETLRWARGCVEVFRKGDRLCARAISPKLMPSTP